MSHPPTDGTPEPSAAGRPSPPEYPPLPGEPAGGQPWPAASGTDVPATDVPGTAISGAAVPGAAGAGTDAPGAALSDARVAAAGEPVPAPPRKRRAGLIAAASLAIVLVLCGGGGTAAFLLLRGTESGEGAAQPVTAVDAFLQAVYTDKDATRAIAMVCVEARDEAAITEKVREVQGYETTYVNPRFRWDPPTVATENEERAIVSVKLTMTTGDEKRSEQQLRFTVVRKTGWWVCEVG